jgi:hypothetical protein
MAESTTNSYTNIVVKRSLVRASDGEMLAEFNNSFSLSVGAGIIQWFCVDGSVIYNFSDSLSFKYVIDYLLFMPSKSIICLRFSNF